MQYNFKRALGISIALYVATLVAAIICGVVTGQEMTSISNMPEYFWYLGMVAAVVFTALCAMWYFKNPELIASAKSGLLFGLTGAAVSALLDFIFFSLGNSENMGLYYKDYRYWIILVLVIVTAKIVGYKKGKKTTQAVV